MGACECETEGAASETDSETVSVSVAVASKWHAKPVFPWRHEQQRGKKPFGPACVRVFASTQSTAIEMHRVRSHATQLSGSPQRRPPMRHFPRL